MNTSTVDDSGSIKRITTQDNEQVVCQITEASIVMFSPDMTCILLLTAAAGVEQLHPDWLREVPRLVEGAQLCRHLRLHHRVHRVHPHLREQLDRVHRAHLRKKKDDDTGHTGAKLDFSHP